MSAATVALRLTADLDVAARVEKLLAGLTDDQCEAVLHAVDDYRTAAKLELEGDALLRAVTVARDRVEERPGPIDEGTRAAEEPPPEAEGTPAPRSKDDRHLTDVGNAKALVDSHGADLRFSAAIGWFIWDERRWAADQSREIVRRAIATVLAMYRRALDALKEAKGKARDGWKELLAHAERSESASRIHAMVKLAESHTKVQVKLEDLDADRYLIAAPNGVVDLRTGALLPHDRNRLITKLAGADYAPDAASERWTRFLEAQVPDPSERGFLHRAVGAALIAPREERLYFLAGPAASGKGTFCSAVLAAVGELGATSDPEVFAERGSREAQLEMSRLFGRRIVVLPELKRGEKLALRILKQISGGDAVRARDHYRQAFDFRPSFTMFFSTNHVPRVDPSDVGAWRRVTVIKFPRTVPEGERDSRFKESLCIDPDQRRAVLSWIVGGARLYVEAGEKLVVPAAVSGAGEEWKSANDPLHPFFTAECAIDPAGWASTEDIERVCTSWARDMGNEPPSWNAIAKALRDRGCEPKRARSEREGQPTLVRGWKGIRLKAQKEHADLFAEEVRHEG